MATSIRVQEDLKKRSIRLSSKPSRRAATHADAATLPALPLGTGSFQSLTPDLYQRIRDHYQPMNDRFAQAVWGVASWAELFQPPIPHLPRHRWGEGRAGGWSGKAGTWCAG